MHVRFAMVQFRIKHLDREGNLQRIEAFTREAKKKHAQVIVFPEDCITGSIFGDLSKLDTTQANKKAFQTLAKKYAIDIVTGSSMEGTPKGNFNTSYYVNAKGKVLGTYSKNHLYPSEKKFLQPGIDAPVFKTAYGKAAMVICWDMLFPELFQRLKNQGVEIIYCPSFWFREIAESMKTHNPRSEEEQMDALCIVRSLETNAAFVYVNAAGVTSYPNGTKDTCIGHSQVVMPVLGAIKKMNHNREELCVVDVDLDVLKASKKIYHA